MMFRSVLAGLIFTMVAFPAQAEESDVRQHYYSYGLASGAASVISITCGSKAMDLAVEKQNSFATVFQDKHQCVVEETGRTILKVRKHWEINQPHLFIGDKNPQADENWGIFIDRLTKEFDSLVKSAASLAKTED